MRLASAKIIHQPERDGPLCTAAVEYDRLVAEVEKRASGAFDELDEARAACSAIRSTKDLTVRIERRCLGPDAAEFAEQALHDIWRQEDDHLQWHIETDVDEMVSCGAGCAGGLAP